MRYIRKADNTDIHLGTEYWRKYLLSLLKQNRNFLGCFIGETGKGKSYSALSMIEILIEKQIDMRDVFTDGISFVNRLYEIVQIPKEDRGVTALLWDETGKDLSSKKWQNKMNQIINIILQVCTRSENIIVFFTVPFFSFIDSDARKLMHGLFEAQAIDFERKETILKPFLIQTNQRSGKSYPKYLRIEHDGGLVPVERIRLPLPHAETIEKYEELKKNTVLTIIKEAKEKIENGNRRSLGKYNGEKLTYFEERVSSFSQEGKNAEDIAIIMGKSPEMIRKTLLRIPLKLEKA